MSLPQSLTAMAYLILFLCVWKQVRLCPGRGEPLALLIVAVHGVVYSAALLINKMTAPIDPIAWNTWSSALRLHVTFTVAAIEFLRWRRLEAAHGCK